MSSTFFRTLLLIILSTALLVACSKSESQFDPPEMVFAGAEDYVKGLEFLKKEDVSNALPWLEKAVVQGNPEANYHLGLLYARGDHLKQDYQKAHEYLYSAAMMGHPKALYYLGHMYGEGSGVQQDYVAALKWFWLAASYGDRGAKQYLRVMIGKVTPDEYSRAEQQVNELWKKLPHDVFLKDEKMALH